MAIDRTKPFVLDEADGFPYYYERKNQTGIAVNYSAMPVLLFL